MSSTPTIEPAERPSALGERMHEFIRELYPLCRSITGGGLRETLRRIARRIPLEIAAVPSGTEVLDWVVPPEWNIRDAFVADASGKRVIDFRESNLHVVSYSEPVRARLTLDELRPHLHSLPGRPDWIPYRTSYYRRTWGFCVSETVRKQLREGVYEVCIDSTLEEGELNYGECYLPGSSEDEVLVPCHACHPSLCNDNLSGVSLAVSLAEALAERTRRYSYRFLFLPVTIGAIAWLARNEHLLPRIRHGLILASVGDPGAVTYKRSRRGDAEIDRVMTRVLFEAGGAHNIVDFTPYGYDERQFCSPGFDLPVGCFSRTPYGQYPEYHTSADNLDFVQPRFLEDSWRKCMAAFEILETNRAYVNLHPKGEPQLGKRGLYPAAPGGPGDNRMALLWTLNQSDGAHTLLDIAERSGLPFQAIQSAAATLERHELLRPAG